MLVRKEFDFDIRTDCWDGAKDRIDSLTPDMIDTLESMIENPDLWSGETPTDVEVNDFIWFEDDTYANWFGFADAEQLWAYCKLVVDNGVDEDSIWIDYDGNVVTDDDVIAAYTDYDDEDGYYADWEEWAEDNGYEKFEI